MAREDFPASWTTNTIQVISKSHERNFLGNYRTIMLDTISDKFYGFILERFIPWWVELKGFKVRGTRRLIYFGPHPQITYFNWTTSIFTSTFLFMFHWCQKLLTKFHVTNSRNASNSRCTTSFTTSYKSHVHGILYKSINQWWHTWWKNVRDQC